MTLTLLWLFLWLLLFGDLAMLTLKNVSVSINKMPILKNISFTTYPGEHVAVIGQNGSGKTTLVRAITRDIAINKGAIFLNDVKISTLSRAQCAAYISHLQQNVSLGTIGHLTVAQNLLFASQGTRPFLPIAMPFNIKKIKDTLPLSLKKYLKKPTHLLSGGERQLLSLMMILQKNTPFLILDEVTSALDPQTAHLVMRKSTTALKEKNKTSLFITHNLEHALTYSSRIVVMRSGSIVDIISKEQMKNYTPSSLAAHLLE